MQFTTSKIFTEDGYSWMKKMPSVSSRSCCSVQSNTKPPTDAPLTAVLPGINTLREQICHNTDQPTSKVSVRAGGGDRTVCKVTDQYHYGGRRISLVSNHTTDRRLELAQIRRREEASQSDHEHKI